ncbi:hypothetical protein [Geoglobus sp.]
MRKILPVFFLIVLVVSLSGCTLLDGDREIKQAYEEALKTFNDFRGTDLNPPLQIVDTEWVVEKWGSYQPREELFYKAMMLLPANYTFEKAKEHDLSSFVAFTWEGKIYVVRDNYDPETFKRTVYHELEHLYQERFNISSDGTFDGEKAKASTIEGDAKLISRIIAGESYEKERQSEVSEDNAYFLLGYAPYLYGFNLAIEVYNRTGDTKEMLERPPSSMEQVMHPEKYFSREGFEQVSLNGGEQNRLGELFLFFFLAAHVDDVIARVAAEGWNGDAYTLNDSGWAWKIAFDSEKDANEFIYACVNMLEKLGRKEGDHYVIEEKYLPQKIKVVRDGSTVTLTSRFLEV